MDPIASLIVGLVIGIVLGTVIGLLFARARRADAPLGVDPALLASQNELALGAVRAEEATARAQLAAELAA
ncbi:MAG: DNA recombination protein RmuC, partial [Candidatus Saccharibacteria bacterium]|nr:DNA recombination protein RmuC [Microbacteriaceae bacterium]